MLFLDSVQQNTSKGVIMAAGIAQHAFLGQTDSDLVTSLQFHGNNNGVAVLQILTVSFLEPRRHFAINLQIGTSVQLACS